MAVRSCCSARKPATDPGTVAVERAEAYTRAHAARFVRELAELVRYPSVSSDPGHRGDMHRCAAWLADHLSRIGFDEARVLDTGGHPAVCGHWLRAPGRPTVLVYGHYDVQPADPIREWSTPPFQPAVRGGRIYGRGAADDKGQFFAHLKAAEALLRTGGMLPVNVKCLLEGEEEIGSPNLAAFLDSHPREAQRPIRQWCPTCACWESIDRPSPSRCAVPSASS